jgi:hypothetical protein
MKGRLSGSAHAAWSLCQREWKFLLCFALAAYVATAAVDFLDRTKVYHCVGTYRCR